MSHPASFWYLLCGGLLIGVGFIHSLLKRLPISTAIVYLVTGILFGPNVFGILKFDFRQNSALIEHVTEIILIASVFTAGLLAKPRLRSKLWLIPLRLAFIGVAITVLLIALLATHLGMDFGHALLLGAVLAPTDPVLATEVQVKHEDDADPLRFSLTAEAGMNDASAFPFVYLALGISGLHEVASLGETWFLRDVLYKFIGGGAVGFGASFLAIALLNRHQEKKPNSIALYDFFGLGLLLVIYGLSLAFDVYGFVAAFIGGLCFRRVENTEASQAQIKNEPSLSAETASQSISFFNTQIERFGEMACVFWVGVTLNFDLGVFYLIPVALIFLIRPVSVYLGTLGAKWTHRQRRLAAWFGIRGVGSLYYLSYAIHHEKAEVTDALLRTVLVSIALSILLHGITATPLMRSYRHRR